MPAEIVVLQVSSLNPSEHGAGDLAGTEHVVDDFGAYAEQAPGRVRVMADQVALPDARAHLDDLVHRAAQHRVTITDQGRAAAVLISPAELADLDEAAALARYRADHAAGNLRTVTHAEARTRLATP